MAAYSAGESDLSTSEIKDEDKTLWQELTGPVRQFLLNMSVFIISIKSDYKDIPLWNSYFIQALRYFGMKIRVLENPCVPYKKIVKDTGATYVRDATLRGLCANEGAWTKLSSSPQSLGVLG